MLKRTMILLGLTITVGALLLVVGCGGHNSTMPVGSGNQTVAGPTRGDQQDQPPSSPQLQIGTTIWGYHYIGVRSVDPEGDRLQYRVVLEGPVTIVFDQTQGQGNWFTTPWGTQPVSNFASGQWGFIKFNRPPSGSYVIKAQAFDGQQWGPNRQLPLKF